MLGRCRNCATDHSELKYLGRTTAWAQQGTRRRLESNMLRKQEAHCKLGSASSNRSCCCHTIRKQHSTV